MASEAEFLKSEPSAETLAKIEARLKTVGRVRPLPSEGVLAAFAVAAFVALAIVFSAPVGYVGLHARGAWQAFLEYAALVASGTVLAVAVAGEMIPGSKRSAFWRVAAILPFLALGAAEFLLFPASGNEPFVERGIPCLRMGLLCAIPSAGLAWLFIRRGYVTAPVSAALTGGLLAGLVGVGALALHCPVLNAAHILTWHVGVIAICAGAGALAGVLSQRRGAQE